MLAVITHRTGAMPFYLGGAKIWPPDYADILLVGYIHTAFNRGIQLDIKGTFTLDGQVNYLIFYKITPTPLKRAISAFVANIRQ
jgi:hypothetical protein